MPESFMRQVEREFRVLMIGNPIWARVMFDAEALPEDVDVPKAMEAFGHALMAVHLSVLRVAAEVDAVRAECLKAPE